MKNHYEKVHGYDQLHQITPRYDKETGLIVLDFSQAPEECEDDIATACRNWTEVFWRREVVVDTALNYEFLLSVQWLLLQCPVDERKAACKEQRQQEGIAGLINDMEHKHRVFAYLLKAIPDLNKHKLIKIIIRQP